MDKDGWKCLVGRVGGQQSEGDNVPMDMALNPKLPICISMFKGPITCDSTAFKVWDNNICDKMLSLV